MHLFSVHGQSMTALTPNVNAEAGRTTKFDCQVDNLVPSQQV